VFFDRSFYTLAGWSLFYKLLPMTPTAWTNFGMQLLWAMPYWLVCLAAVVIAFMFRKRCPRAATFAAVGSAILFLNTMLGAIFSSYLIGMAQNHALTNAQYATASSIVALVKAVLAMAGFVLVFVAVFTERGKSSAPSVPPQLPPHA